ncbi:hypothetical protein P7C71_g6340, partial [Lecanoromycetidae sp. Uapishka_2]
MADSGDDTPRSQPLKRLIKSKSLQNLRERLLPSSRAGGNAPPVPVIPKVHKSAIGAPRLTSTTNEQVAETEGLQARLLDAEIEGLQARLRDLTGGMAAYDTIDSSGSIPSSKLTSPQTGTPTNTNDPLSTLNSAETKAEASTGTIGPSSSPTSPQTQASAAMSNQAAIDRQYPEGDPYAAKRLQYPPIQYPEPGKATALHSNPVDHDQIEYDRKSMGVAKHKKKHPVKAKEAQYGVQDKAKATKVAAQAEVKKTDKESPADVSEEGKERQKGSPLKKLTYTFGSKLKGVFNKKET